MSASPAADCGPQLDLTRKALAAADALLITAGAGMGVDSGLPDFRGTEGFWRAYPAIAKQGLRFEELARPGWFRLDPGLAWAFYGHRLNLYRSTVPHAGFGILKRWAERCRLGAFVFTSNVDGQFQQAGFDLDRVVECHGSLLHLQCLTPCTRTIRTAAEVTVTVNEATFRAEEPLPRCPRCGGMARPNVLLFGDGGWVPDRTDAQQAALEAWLANVRQERARLVVVELGAGTALPTVREFSEEIAREFGGTLIRVNPREAQIPAGHHGLALEALAGLRWLDACWPNNT
jgi:NAD-dependent SIR2 family protein deacetylase